MDEKCRLCLNQIDSNQTSVAKIGDELFSNKLSLIFNFSINASEWFPSSVCLQCETKVEDYYTYHELVKNNQDQLWAVQHQKHFVEVKEEPDSVTDFELPFEEAEPVLQCTERVLENILDSPENVLERKEDMNPASGYESSDSPSGSSDGSEYKEEKTKTPLRSGRTKSVRSAVTRQTRPVKRASIKLSTQKKSTERKRKTTDETNQRLLEFYDMKCEMCDEKLDCFTALKNHYYKQHQTQGYIKCCGRTFHSRYRLLEHLSYHVGASMVRCEICNKNFSSRSYLLVHKSRVHGQDKDRPFKCTQCHQSYAMECHLKAHIVSHVRVNCTICGKELASTLSLRTHMFNMHRKRENHICESCGKEFRSRQAFEKHIKMHKGLDTSEQMQCTVCSKWLNSKRALQMHVKLVHTEAGQTFQCNLCTQQCPNSRALANHKQRVHVEERFKCEECGKLFKRRLYLKEHVAALHTRKPLYSCEVCGATFNSNANKYSHRKNKHPVEWEARRKLLLEQQQEQQLQAANR